MLTDKEAQFLLYWKKNRDRENMFFSKLSRGIPMSLLFSLPILLFVVTIWLFFPDWYTKISQTPAGTFITVIFAIIGIVLFFSFFRMQYKWEMNEQLYSELKQKEKLITASEELAGENKNNL